MSDMLSGKVAVITGAASGLGREIALRFAAQGARGVVVADVRPDPREGGEPTHEILDCETRFVQCDVADVDDIQAAVDAADELGGVDVMVNNAGICRLQDFLEVTPEDYDQTMDINVRGTYFGSQRAARKMVARGSGVIINMSSVAGLRGGGPFASYCTSKGAVRTLTYALASALGPMGVRANAIHPGTMDTEMARSDIFVVVAGEAPILPIPLGRNGEPGDVANAAVFLASDMSSYINGASLIVDGGMAMTL